MIHTVTGNYQFPLQHAGPFDIDSCRTCHAQAEPFRAAEAHRDPDIQRALLDREMGCTGVCHEAAHPPQALEGEAEWDATREAHR
jgi:ferredoxin